METLRDAEEVNDLQPLNFFTSVSALLFSSFSTAEASVSGPGVTVAILWVRRRAHTHVCVCVCVCVNPSAVDSTPFYSDGNKKIVQ